MSETELVDPTCGVRKSEVSDCKEIAEILRNDLGYNCSDELVKRKLSQIDDSREAVFAAVKNGAVIGVIHIEKYDLLYFETMANILGLAVKNECRRTGVGGRLIRAAEVWAKENGAVSVRLSSGADRTGAHAFYASMGYTSEKDQRRFIKEL